MLKKSTNLDFFLAGILFKIKIFYFKGSALTAFTKRHRQFLTENTGDKVKTIVSVRINIDEKGRFLRQKNLGLPWENNSLIYWTQKGRFSGIIDYLNQKADFNCADRLFCLNRVLRFIFAVFNLGRGGLLLHASSVAEREKAYSFFGKEGVGKSTIAKISGAEILSDDSTIIFPINDRFYISTMPFDSKLKKRKANFFPLAIILKLNQAKKDQLLELKENPVSSVLNHTRPNLQFFKKCPKMAARQFENCVALAASVPIKSLRFRKDNSFWKLIR